MAEPGRDRARQPVDQPRLAVVVVHREGAVRLQMTPHGLHRLAGEQEGFEADLRGAADQRQRIRQREQDQVVLLVRAFQEGAAVVDVPRHARIGIRAIDVLFAADLEDAWIDVDCVDMPRPFAERDRHVRAGAGADD